MMTENELLFIKEILSTMSDEEVQLLLFKVLDEYAKRYMSFKVLINHIIDYCISDEKD